MSQTASDAGSFATKLMRQAVWPPVVAVVIACALLVSAQGNPALWVTLVLIVSALAILALSGLLAFDALLFRVIASHPDETTGCAAVDDILARMRLKPYPAQTRTLSERIAGTHRLLVRQRAALAIFATCALIVGMAKAG